MLVGVLEAFSLLHSPLSKERFLKVVRDLFKLGEDWSSYHWLNDFMYRHKDRLNSHTVQGIQSERVTTDVFSNTKIFVEVYGNYLEQHYLSADHVINGDETPLIIKGKPFFSDYIESNEKKRLHTCKRETLEQDHC